VNRVRTLALSPVPYEGAGARYRIAQYIPHLATQGIDLTIAPFFDREFFELVYQPGRTARKALLFMRQAIGRLRTVLQHGRYDLIVIYREAMPVGPPIVESMLAAAKVPLVYDFDDAVFLPNTSEANRWIGGLKNPQKTGAIIRKCNSVIAGNEFLAAYARRFNSSVHVIPTAIDVDLFVPRATPPPSSEPLVVGWIGTPTTASYLEPLAPVLQALTAAHRFEFRVAGSTRSLTFEGVNTNNVPWSLDREVELFNQCDIGVYPLPDDDWARGKCGFKAIQFMSCGVPVVASAVGVNREIVQDGVNGFLATTPDEWRRKLTLLMTDAALRHRLGGAGRKTIQERYSLQVNGPRVAAVIGAALVGARAADTFAPFDSAQNRSLGSAQGRHGEQR
jgi:glycosyltransferase involved in cell wall biosynthesis